MLEDLECFERKEMHFVSSGRHRPFRVLRWASFPVPLGDVSRKSGDHGDVQLTETVKTERSGCDALLSVPFLSRREGTDEK